MPIGKRVDLDAGARGGQKRRKSKKGESHRSSNIKEKGKGRNPLSRGER